MEKCACVEYVCSETRTKIDNSELAARMCLSSARVLQPLFVAVLPAPFLNFAAASGGSARHAGNSFLVPFGTHSPREVGDTICPCTHHIACRAWESCFPNRGQ